MDGRYKEGIKDLIEAAMRSEVPFSPKTVKKEQRRLIQLALFATGLPLLVLGLLFYIQEVAFSSEAAIISLILAGFSVLFFAVYLLTARWDMSQLPFQSGHIWAYWYAYLKKRMRFFWLLYVAVIFAMASLINVTYDIHQSYLAKGIALVLVGLASVILVNNFFKAPYGHALREAEKALS